MGKTKKTTKKKSPAKSRALPSATLPSVALIDTGARFNSAALDTFATTILEKITPAFARFGINDGWKSDVRSLVTDMTSQAAKLQAGKEDALPTAEALDDATSAAKEWRRDAHTILSSMPGKPIALTATGSATGKLVTAVTTLAPKMSAASTQPFGGGAAFGAQGKALAKDLAAKLKAHRAAIAKLSPEQKNLHQLKGVLYEELKRVARIARRVAPTDAHAFAPSAHLVTHRRKHKAPPAPPVPPPIASPTPTP